jgi:hypothetical protein
MRPLCHQGTDGHPGPPIHSTGDGVTGPAAADADTAGLVFASRCTRTPRAEGWAGRPMLPRILIPGNSY